MAAVRLSISQLVARIAEPKIQSPRRHVANQRQLPNLSRARLLRLLAVVFAAQVFARVSAAGELLLLRALESVVACFPAPGFTSRFHQRTLHRRGQATRV